MPKNTPFKVCELCGGRGVTKRMPGWPFPSRIVPSLRYGKVQGAAIVFVEGVSWKHVRKKKELIFAAIENLKQSHPAWSCPPKVS